MTLISHLKGLPCRGGCTMIFQAASVPAITTIASRTIRAHDDAQVTELLKAAQVRNAHEMSEHQYDHGNRLMPKATPFHDNDGHSNKTLRWDLQPS